MVIVTNFAIFVNILEDVLKLYTLMMNRRVYRKYDYYFYIQIYLLYINPRLPWDMLWVITGYTF